MAINSLFFQKQGQNFQFGNLGINLHHFPTTKSMSSERFGFIMPRKAKTKQSSSLGRSLINDRFGKKKVERYIHANDLPGNTAKSDKNLISVTERSSLDDFLATAEMAGTEFTAEKLNVHYVESNQKGINSPHDGNRLAIQNEFRHLLSIPRRPPWNSSTSKQQLEALENDSFLSWRRKLAEVEENSDVLFTPYEKNLDFWRQLWRVIERSDVIVQIVDARNPLMFRCRDVEAYVKQVDSSKRNLLLINKADLLSANQRRAWQEYFDRAGVEVAFWSALAENEKLVESRKRVAPEEARDSGLSDDVEEDSSSEESDEEVVSDCDDPKSSDDCDVTEADSDDCDVAKSADEMESTGKQNSLLTRLEFIKFLKSLVPKTSMMIGMVGYPNVGKSSTVNTLLGIKKAAVSATPGRTKHFQTLHIDAELCLCDCPGLVFPSFATSKADMVLSGILPIDQMRDYVSPVNLLAHRIPRKVIEGTYGINIVRPGEGQDPNRPATAVEVLSAHALSRGFMTSHGQPDCSRSARYLLKDYVNGRLLYSVPPPRFDEVLYKSWTTSLVEIVLSSLAKNLSVSEDLQVVADRIHRVNKKQSDPVNELDHQFFRPHAIQVFSNSKAAPERSGKKARRHKKKEKTRRIRTVVY